MAGAAGGNDVHAYVHNALLRLILPLSASCSAPMSSLPAESIGTN